jgi:hypothetical protein
MEGTRQSDWMSHLVESLVGVNSRRVPMALGEPRDPNGLGRTEGRLPVYSLKSGCAKW